MSNFANDDVFRMLFDGGSNQELNDIFGDDLSAELLELAATLKAESGDGLALEATRKRVYMLPGIMGSYLWAKRPIIDDWIWLEPAGLALGGVRKLEFGNEPRPVYASGTFLTAYAKMKLSLMIARYDVEELAYDWRQSVHTIGSGFIDQIRQENTEPVTLVAHSMGGLVARKLAELDPDRTAIDRVITLGTPNFGSYSPVQVFSLNHSLLQKLGALDQFHTPKEIAEKFIRHFPGLIEMLPSPDKRPDEPFFTTAGWPSSGVRPLAAVLNAADTARSTLLEPDDRFIQIIGMNERTIQNAEIENSQFVFSRTRDGDGTVPREFAEMGSVDRYYVDGEHGNLLNIGDCIDAVKDLIETGETSVLRQQPDAGGLGVESLQADSMERLTSSELREEVRAPAEGLTMNDLTSGLVRGSNLPLAQAPEAGTTGAPARPEEAIPTAQAHPEPDQSYENTEDDDEVMLCGYPVSALAKAAGVWEENLGLIMSAEAFADSGKPMKAEPKLRQEKYIARLMREAGREVAQEDPAKVPLSIQESLNSFEREPEVDSLGQERVFELEDFLSVRFLKRAPHASKCVGRIVDKASGSGFGTGFLIAPGILITNHHVFRASSEAARSLVQFDYELATLQGSMKATEFALQPERFFVNDESLDMACVAVSPQSLDGAVSLTEYGYMPLIDEIGKIRAESPVNIIQHPKAKLKQVVFRNSTLKPLPESVPGQMATTAVHRDNVLLYTGDTEPGSSGSPVFNDRWEVVGLHHSAVPIRNDQGRYKVYKPGYKTKRTGAVSEDDFDYLTSGQIRSQGREKDVVWVANEGIRVSKLVAKIRQFRDTSLKPSHVDHLNRILAAGETAKANGPHHHLPPAGGRSGGVSVLETTGGGESQKVEAAGGGVTQSPRTSGPAVSAPLIDGNTLTVTVPVEISVRIGGSGAQSSAPSDPVRSLDAGTTVSSAEFVNERLYKPAELAGRTGFNRDFLGAAVELPNLLNTSPYSLAPRKDGAGHELKYDHYSVLMCKERRLAFVSAGNFDPDAPEKPKRDKEPWSIDPRIKDEFQANNDFYKSNDLDRGHLFRRTDGSWGDTRQAALRADHDTYFWTNIAPQHKIYNRSSLEKEWNLWGQLENHVTSHAGNSRLTIMNGPVFHPDDPVHRGLLIPRSFWKIVVGFYDGALHTFVFKIGQDSLLSDLPEERFEAGEFGVYQIKLRDLEAETHLDFGMLKASDVMESIGASENFRGNRGIVRLGGRSDIVNN